MAVTALQQGVQAQHGLRMLDPRRDLPQVAELIGEAFAAELEPGGRAALREYQTLGHFGPLITLLGRANDAFQELLGGFVWVENDRVVGNVTIQRQDTYGRRWQIANVAVAPQWRGRGIARALMTAALEWIEERGGSWVILQVRRDNVAAKGLYERLGFESVGSISDWRLSRIPKNMPQVVNALDLRPLRNREWAKVYDLVLACTPALTQWWEPVRPDQFRRQPEQRMSEWFNTLLGRNRMLRLGLDADNQHLAATVTLNAARWYGEHRLRLRIHPTYWGRLEEPLLHQIMRLLVDYPRFPVSINHDGEHHQASDVLRYWGFVERRTLVMMRRPVANTTHVPIKPTRAT